MHTTTKDNNMLQYKKIIPPLPDLNDESDLTKAFESFVNAIISAIEARDPATAGHSTRVANYTLKTAVAINNTHTGPLKDLIFTTDQIDELRYAALLHDIGKIGVPEKILLKAEKCHHDHFNAIIQKTHRFEEKQCNNILMQYFNEKKQIPKEILFQRTDAIRLKYDTFRQTLLKLQAPNSEPSIEDIVIIDEIAKTTLPENPDDPLMTPEETQNFKIRKGSLTPEERRKVETHPLLSYKYLSQIPWPEKWKNIPAIAAAHHEKLNGTGYPHALTADKISYQTRIITVCDIYDALTGNDRPYKKNYSEQNALGILYAEAGMNAIDNDVLDIFINNVLPRVN